MRIIPRMEAIATIRFNESGILYRAGVDLAISTLERVIRFVCQSVYGRPAKNGPVDGWRSKENSASEDGQRGDVLNKHKLTWDRLGSLRFREGGYYGREGCSHHPTEKDVG
jgi:hypothetical protein